MFKITVVGNPASGKTSLCKRLVYDTFSTNYNPTALVDFFVKDNLRIWDISGHQNYSNLARSYYKDADAIIVCSDELDMNGSVKYWLDEIRNYSSTQNIIIVITKNDYCDDFKSVEQFSGFQVLRTSAKKSPQSVKYCFDIVTTLANNKGLYNIELEENLDEKFYIDEDDLVDSSCLSDTSYCAKTKSSNKTLRDRCCCVIS